MMLLFSLYLYDDFCCVYTSLQCTEAKLHISQDLKEEIDSRLSKVNDIRYEPHLLSKDDDRLKHQGQNGERNKEAPSSFLHNTVADMKTYAHVCVCAGCYNYLFRMQALDAIRDSGKTLFCLCVV